MGKEFHTNVEMEAILKGAGDYCEKLKQAGFHYICKEKVKETLSFSGQNFTDDIGAYENRASESDMLKRSEPRLGYKKRKVEKFVFDYQIVKDRSGIKEQRKLISRKKKQEGENAGLQLSAFLSEKAVFSPVTLLAIERQPLYEYRFIGNEKLEGIPCTVIEVIPISNTEAQYVYGQVWIDTRDHSVLKIKVNPRSIVGYSKLEYIAKMLASKLILNLEISFRTIHQGLRFADRIILSEVYKGGRLPLKDGIGRLSYQCIGPDGWERNRTEYSYKDYQFFVVDVEVSAESEDQ